MNIRESGGWKDDEAFISLENHLRKLLPYFWASKSSIRKYIQLLASIFCRLVKKRGSFTGLNIMFDSPKSRIQLGRQGFDTQYGIISLH
jgi:hypothetical protein